MSVKININKLDKDAVNPLENKNDVLELTCITKEIKNNYVEYGTGINIEIPKGYAGILFPIETIYKTDLIAKDSIGVINPNNKEEIKIRFLVTENTLPHTYNVGDKIARLIILPVAKYDFKWKE